DRGGGQHEGQRPAGHRGCLHERRTGPEPPVGTRRAFGRGIIGRAPWPVNTQTVAAQSDSHTSETPSFSVAEKPRTVSRGTDSRSATAARRGFLCALPTRSSFVAATRTRRPEETR